MIIKPWSMKTHMRSFVLLLVCLSFSSINAQLCQTPIWGDEFSGNSLDINNWEPQIGDGCALGICGWGNSELQFYKAENATVANDILTITAKRERNRGSKYTSARLRTANMPNSGEWTFGRYEARMKLPAGQGMWPAFWMLPTDPAQGWPMSGEIDIVETIGQQSEFVYGTLHFGQPYPGNRSTQGNILMQPPARWSDDYHVYAIEWDANEIRWYVDNLLYSTKTVADVQPEDWPFDGRNQFHLIVNLAVGGTWGGSVDDKALPQTLLVDYVRVYGGNQANLSGSHLGIPGREMTYQLENGSATGWSVTGGSVVSSSNSSATVIWDAASASTTQTLTASTSNCDVTTNVYVGAAKSVETVLDDYDGTANIQVTSTSGNYVVSGGVLTYTRDSASQYDVIAATTSAIPDAGVFVNAEKVFEIDVNNTDAGLVGKPIIVQLEDSSTATPTNFPGGRHSRYLATIDNANGWQTLTFTLQDRLDGATADSAVDSMAILIDANTFNGDTYVLDNFHIMGEGSGTPNQSPTADISQSCTNLDCSFDGSGSSDPDGSIASYSWDFGDGNSSTAQSPNHSYASAGEYTVELTVTDNEGATNTASVTINVTDEPGGEATNIVISNVATGTQGAGRGKKYGKATITVLDNLGNPAAGVAVTGDFSGTFNETASGVTGSDGTITLLTSSTASGGVSVNFCVSSATGALPLDTGASTGLCQ